MHSTCPWQIERANPEDADAVYALMRSSFFFHEPATKRLYEEEGEPPMECCMSIQALVQGLSFKAVSSSGDIVGVALNLNKEGINEDAVTSFEPMKKLLSFFNYVDGNSLGNEKNWLTLQVLAVHTSWRRQGIADKLVQATLEEAISKKYSGVRVMCTSAFTAQLFQKKGWELVYRLPYAEYLNGQGEAVFSPEPPHEAVTVYVMRNKKLQ